MIFLFYSLIFIFGSAVGSFLGVIVDRAVNGEPFWKGRSHCDHCRHTLHIMDLIPIVSYFLLGRKCRYCHKPLSWFYPLIELVTGLSYVIAVYVVFQQSSVLLSQVHYQLMAIYYVLLIGALISILFTDLKYGIIPFGAVGFAFLITILWYASLALSGFHVDLLGAVFSSLGAGGIFLLLFAVTKGRGMGFGDVVYAFLMGFILGFPQVLLGLYIAFVSGAVIALLLVALKIKKFKGGTIPFGPFLVLGTCIGLLWGEYLITLLLRVAT